MDTRISGLRILAEQYGRLVLTRAIVQHERVALDLPNAETKISASLSQMPGNSETLWIAIEGDTAALTADGARDLADMLLGLADAVQAHRAARVA